MKLLDQKGLSPIVLIAVLAVLSSAIIFKYLHSKPINQASLAPNLVNVIPTLSPTPSPTLTPTPTSTPTLTVTSLPKPTATSPATTPEFVSTNNTPPGFGYSYQTVSVEGQNFPVSIVAADLSSTKVIVDTASDSDCSNNCPTLPLSDYVARSGAYAGINGSFFCPVEYPRAAAEKPTLLIHC